MGILIIYISYINGNINSIYKKRSNLIIFLIFTY